MLINYDLLNTMLLILTYMTIYNLTSFVLFITILQITGSSVKTLYAFANLDTSNVLTKILAVSLLSLAGVPPLLGFFSKIFVFVLLTSSNLSTLFLPFFILLFVGLYFYVQNLRFLHSTNGTTLSLNGELQNSTNFLYFTFSLSTTFLLLFGVYYLDDLLLIALWLLV